MLPKFSSGPSFKEIKASGACAIGKRYEKKVCAEIGSFSERESLKYLIAPWIEYEVASKKYYAQPDALIQIDPTTILLIEIKLKNTKRAFIQFDTYKNLLSQMFPSSTFYCLLVCKYFDPSEGILPIVDSFSEAKLPISALVLPL